MGRAKDSLEAKFGRACGVPGWNMESHEYKVADADLVDNKINWQINDLFCTLLGKLDSERTHSRSRSHA